jgi:hypothetical protein
MLLHHKATINSKVQVTHPSLLSLQTQETPWYEMMLGSCHSMKVLSSLARQHVQHSHHACVNSSYTPRQRSTWLEHTTSKTPKSYRQQRRMQHGRVDLKHTSSLSQSLQQWDNVIIYPLYLVFGVYWIRHILIDHP